MFTFNVIVTSWIEIDSGRKLSPFYATIFSVTNFKCQMLFDSVNEGFLTNLSKIKKKTFNTFNKQTFDRVKSGFHNKTFTTMPLADIHGLMIEGCGNHTTKTLTKNSTMILDMKYHVKFFNPQIQKNRTSHVKLI